MILFMICISPVSINAERTLACCLIFSCVSRRDFLVIVQDGSRRFVPLREFPRRFRTSRLSDLFRNLLVTETQTVVRVLERRIDDAVNLERMRRETREINRENGC